MGDRSIGRQVAKPAKQEPATRADAIARRVIGAAIEVHKLLGPGYLESVYEEALAVELKLLGVPFVRQVPFALDYKGHAIGKGCIDLLVDGDVVVELKAVEALAPVHQAQVISYLRAMKKELGLLINFQQKAVVDGIRRVVLT
jgi:GxxExxY protein